jgi:chromosome partitioning protein
MTDALAKLTPAQWQMLRIRRKGKPHRLVTANKKGGSGKTTTVVSLACAFAAWGARVRITDADPQLASATFWLPPRAPAGWPTLLDVFEGERSLAEVAAPTGVPGVTIVPSLDTLARVEIERPPGTESLLSTEFAAADDCDLDLMDAPPSMGTLTVALLAAATDVMLTLKASSFDFVGTAEIRKPLALVRKRINPELRVSAITLVDTDNATIISKQLQARIAEEYASAVQHSIPHSVRAAEAPGTHRSLIDYAPDNPVTLAYFALAARLVPVLGFDWVVSPDDLVRAA